MATPRQVRTAAFQALYQLDARGGAAEEDREDILASLEAGELSESERRRALETALGAYGAREDADRAMEELAPGWPAHRQAAVDRAILRLAHFEMASGSVNPKVIINEAVELAKKYSTERSPAFINALLDRWLKRDQAARPAAAEGGAD